IFLTQAVPFLYRAVAPQVVLRLVECFYDCNRALFKDPKEQHMCQARAMLAAVSQSYVESLPPSDRAIYEALDHDEQNAFRICRDLALRPEPSREPLSFFGSFEHFGARLGVFPVQTQRVMRRLETYGVIRLLEKGTRRAARVPAIAGKYKWLV